MPDYSGHMTHDEYIAIRREELLGIARDVLNNRILGVEACVRMAPMLGELNLRQDEDLLIKNTQAARYSSYCLRRGISKMDSHSLREIARSLCSEMGGCGK